jgi:RNA polymerase sigma-70 factor (ECF subfamily)
VNSKAYNLFTVLDTLHCPVGFQVGLRKSLKPGGALSRINRGEGPTRMPADDEITALIHAGRVQEAFERLMPAYRRRVFGLAYSLLRDRGAAEDVAQEVFVKLWQALPRYDGRAQLSTWIYAITRNTAISAMRKRRRSLSLSDPVVEQEVESRGAQLATEPADDALWRTVATLPDKQRQAVTLYYQDERGVEEVAAMMSLPVNTVKTHLHRARASLAAALGATGKEDS